MRLLVTGGAGFIGVNFIHYWIKHYPSDTIHVLDNLTYSGNLHSLDLVRNHPRFSFTKGDICDASVVDHVMRGIDVVVHFAAESHVDRSIKDPSVFVRTNVLGTHVLLEAARKYHISRFHHISTDEVFGALHLKGGDAFNEKSPYRPRSPYAASKAASDHLVNAYFHTYTLPITVTNCSNNYGPYQFPEKIIPLFITNLMDGKKVPVYGDGLYVRDWIYVEDHVRAIEAVLDKGRIGETYCVGGGNQISNFDLTKKILTFMGKDESMIESVADRPGHDRRYAIDDKKIREELGWKPMVDLDQGLKKTISWYEENEDWWRPLKEKWVSRAAQEGTFHQ